jgi:hypothetical protein
MIVCFSLLDQLVVVLEADLAQSLAQHQSIY